MKRIISILICVCMLAGVLVINTSAALMGLMSVSLTVPEPKAGEKPGDVKISGTFSEITNVRWEGLDANGCFAPNSDYTVYVNFSLTFNNAKKYEYLADKFKVTVNSSREAEILALSGSSAYVKYTFRNNAGAEFAQDEYGTAVANQNLSIYSLANIGSSTGEKIPEGTAIKVIRAFAPTTTALKCHMVEYNGKTVYIMIWSSNKAPLFRDVKVEGKLDPNNLPANAVPKHNADPIPEPEPEQPVTEQANGAVADFQPGDYGTMTLKKGYACFFEPSTLKQGAFPEFQLTKIGEVYEVVEAYVIPSNKAGTFHAVKYNGKVWYVRIEDSRLAELGDFVKKGNNPERPYHNSMQEQPKPAGYEYKTLGVWNFTATAGKTPEIRFNNVERYVKSIVYSENIVQKPYKWVTATVTYKIEDSKGYFADNLEVKVLESDAICGYEIISKSSDSVVVKFTTVSDNGEAKAQITQEMKDFKEYMSNNSVTRIHTKATEKLNDPTGKAKLYDYPLLLDGGNAAPKSLYIHDVQHHIADLSEDWYYVSDLRALHGFIPAAYVTDIAEYDYFAGAPGTNRRTPFEFAGGSGTVGDPYLVQTAEQLNSIRYKPTLHYKLIADIDLSRWGNWTPIGGTPAYGGYPGDSVNKAQQSSSFFTGSLDGNGHAIYGMQIVINEDKPYMYEGGNNRYYGLFAIITEGKDKKPVISNLDLVNYKIDIRYNNASGSSGGDQYWLGTFAADCLGAKIENCHTQGGSIKLHFTNTDGIISIGGITGECSDSSITRCSNSGDLTVSVGDETIYGYSIQAGGITGKITDSNNITECYNSGDITLPLTGTAWDFHWTNSYAGGISSETAPVLDSANTTYVTNCYNSGNITARAVNDIVVYNGTTTKLYVKNFYNVGKLTYNPAEEGAEPGARDKLIPTTYKTNCTNNGNAVSGAEWQKSASLGRMVLKCCPEDSPIRSNFNFVYDEKYMFVGGFKDVEVTAWYADAVKWAVDRKVTTGTSDTTFSPDNICTRAQILTFLWRAMGSPKATIANPFTDVKDSDYFYAPALWAYEKGMISGNSFEGNTPCTRKETVVYLWKNASGRKIPYSGKFTDVAADADYASAVAWAVNTGVTTGTSETTFSPDNTCTRAQIVTFLNRAIRYR